MKNILLVPKAIFWLIVLLLLFFIAVCAFPFVVIWQVFCIAEEDKKQKKVFLTEDKEALTSIC